MNCSYTVNQGLVMTSSRDCLAPCKVPTIQSDRRTDNVFYNSTISTIWVGDRLFSIKISTISELRKIVLFDGVCSLCNAWVNFLIRIDKKKSLLFSPLQGNYAKKNHPQAAECLDSIVFVDKGRIYYKSGAVLRILGSIGGIWLFAWTLWCIPYFLRDPVYSTIARFRYKLFGKTVSCRVPPEEVLNQFIDWKDWAVGTDLPFISCENEIL